MTIPFVPPATDGRQWYVVAWNHADYLNACYQLRIDPANVIEVRTGDVSALPAVTETVFQEVLIWLYGWWTNDTPPAELETFGLALDALKNVGVLMDTW